MNRTFLKRNYKVSKAKRQEQIRKLKEKEQYCAYNELDNKHKYENGYCRYCEKIQIKD